MSTIRRYKGITPQYHSTVYIDPACVLIGDVHIGQDSSIWPCASIRGDVNKIIIGERSNIQDNSSLHVTHKSEANPNGHPLIIGDDVTIGHQATLHGCHLYDRILVGMGSIILDGSVIESDVMIGAGSLVPPNKHLESGYLYIGSPVKKARPLTEQERAFLKTSANNYIQYKNTYLTGVEIINQE